MDTLVSIIVPVYNVEEYLDRCVESLVQQTYENIEIILVNDGSKDNSFMLCEKWKEKDKRIQVIDKTNGGLSDARNAGLPLAKGEYVAFIDSDDFVDVHMIESMLEKGDSADIIVCDMQYLYDNGDISFASGGDFIESSVKDNPALIAINNSACNKLFKRKMFDDVLFPVGKYYEDLATTPILLYKANKVMKVNQPFYTYYQRTGSIAHTASKQVFDIYDAIHSCIAYVQAHGDEETVIRELNHLYILHGLDLTTLRIKDFDDKQIRVQYLRENMEKLNTFYPTWEKDSLFESYGFKKKMIFKLLKMQKEKMVLKIYDK